MSPLIVLCAFVCSGCAAAEVVDHYMLGHVGRDAIRFGREVSEMPAELQKAAAELEVAAAKLRRELTSAPPPGNVSLSSLGHGLERFEHDPEANFLANAKKDDGTPENFSYVRIGVASYDDFFRTAQELHALTYQATKTVGRIRVSSKKVLGAATGGDLRVSLERATASATGKTKDELVKLGELATMLATLVPQIVAKTDALVDAGKRLVGDAPKDLVDPKLALHVGLVKDGLVASASVIRESGASLTTLMSELGAFRSNG